MKLTEEMADYVSRLSQLTLSGEEKLQMTAELERIISYMEVLNRLDTTGVEPLSHVSSLRNVMRADEIRPSTPRADLLQNAPERDEETFLVPRTVE